MISSLISMLLLGGSVTFLPAQLPSTPMVPMVTAQWSAGNGYYVVTVDPSNGAYTIGTGPNHPVTISEGRMSTVLSGGRNHSTGSFNSIRSFGSYVDYLFGIDRFLRLSSPDFGCLTPRDLPRPEIKKILKGNREVGISATWEINLAPDHLLIEQRVLAAGHDLTGSAGEVTMVITNRSPDTARLGVRYLWNLALGNGGGGGSPAIGPKPPEPPEEPFIFEEIEFAPPDFRSYVLSNEKTPSDPGQIDSDPYTVEATVSGIPLDTPPSRPHLLQYTQYGDQLTPPDPDFFGPLNSCFGFTTFEPPRIVWRGGDNGIAYYWGHNTDTAIELEPGESFSVTQYIVAYEEFPLICDPGSNYTAECTGSETSVELDGSSSSNLEAEGLGYLWSTEDYDVRLEDVATVAPTAFVKELGSHEVELLVHKGAFASGCSAEVEVVDTTPPEILSARVEPEVLWPPNHRMVSVTVDIRANDLCEGEPMVRLVEVRSDEPEDAVGVGDGHTLDDIQGAELDTDDLEILLRAERDGTGDGRTYTLVYEVSDSSGNAVLVPLEVRVPHDRRPSRR